MYDLSSRDRCSAPLDWCIRRKSKLNTANCLPFEQCEIDRSILERWQRIVSLFPHHVAIQNDVTPEKDLTYEALGRLSDRVAYAILATESKSEIIALFFDQSPDAIVAMLGTLKAGYGFVAFDADLPQEDLTSRLTDSLADVVVTTERSYDRVQRGDGGTRQTFLLYEKIVAEEGPGQLVKVSVEGNDLASVMYTSGSTGISKGIARNHSFVLYAAWHYAEQFYLSSRDRVAVAFNWAYGYGNTLLFNCLLNGVTVLLVDPKKTPDFPGWVVEKQITILPLPVSFFRSLLVIDENNPEKRFQVGKCVEAVILGGQMLLWEDIKGFIEKFGCFNTVFRHGYASSEGGQVTAHIFSHPLGQKSGQVPLGYPQPLKDVWIVDEKNQILPQGSVGEIVVCSRYLSSGYWQRSALTATHYRIDSDTQQTCFYSGDMGCVNEKGMLEFFGRKDHMVKVRGYRVELSAIEVVLQGLEGITGAAVVAPELPNGDRYIIAYIAASSPQPSQQDLRQRLKGKLADYAMPSQFVFLDTLPLTVSGKIDRKALPELEMTRPQNNTYVSPKTEIESQLVTLWEKSLDISPIGVTDSIIDIGGDSLAIMLIMWGVKKRFGVEISVSQFLENATIRALARLVEMGDKADMEPLTRPSPKHSFWRQLGMNVRYMLDGMLGPEILVKMATNRLLKKMRSQKKISIIREFMDTIDWTGDPDIALDRALQYNTISNYFVRKYFVNQKRGVTISLPSQYQPDVVGRERIEEEQVKGKGVILVGYHSVLVYWRYFVPVLHDYSLWRHRRDRKEKATGKELYAKQLNHARQLLQQGQIVQVVADGFAGFSKGLEIDFHGRRRIFFLGFAELALLTGAAMIPVFKRVDHAGRGTLTCGSPFDRGDHLVDKEEKIQHILQQYIGLLDGVWRQEPWMVPFGQMRRHLDSPPSSGGEARGLKMNMVGRYRKSF